MGLLEALVDLVAAPITVPLKIVEEVGEIGEKIKNGCQYEYWYHDGCQHPDDYEE